MMYGVVILVHIFVSLVLIGVILLQAGKGGLAETMGGSTAQSILGTSAGTFLTRATAACAILFMTTCISLTLLSSHRSSSLMRMQRRGTALPLPPPMAPAPTPTAPSAATPTMPATTPSTPSSPAQPQGTAP